MMSTYSSFDVCRTPDLRQGIAGPCDVLAAASDCLRGLDCAEVPVDALYGENQTTETTTSDQRQALTLVH